VHVINFLQQRPEWCETAVVIAYDDSDGWYDHQMGPIVNHSTSAQDALTSPVDPLSGPRPVRRRRPDDGAPRPGRRGSRAGALRLRAAPPDARHLSLVEEEISSTTRCSIRAR